jgi:hypothetical protein
MPPRGPEVRGRVALMTGQQLARPEKAADYTQRFAVLQQRTGSVGECTVQYIFGRLQALPDSTRWVCTRALSAKNPRYSRANTEAEWLLDVFDDAVELLERVVADDQLSLAAR